MVREKSTPQRCDDPTTYEEPEAIFLRLRSASGLQGIAGLTANSSLAELRGACETTLGGALVSLSFRDDSMATVSLVSEGSFPALGALLVGPDTRLVDVGLSSGTTLMASISTAAGASSSSVTAKTSSGKKRASASSSGGTKKAKSSGGASLAASSPPSTKKNPLDDLAMAFLHAGGDQGDTLNGTCPRQFFFRHRTIRSLMVPCIPLALFQNVFHY